MTQQASPVHIRSATADDVATIVEFNQLLAVESEDRELDVQVLARGVERALAQPELCRYFMAEMKQRLGRGTGTLCGSTSSIPITNSPTPSGTLNVETWNISSRVKVATNVNDPNKTFSRSQHA